MKSQQLTKVVLAIVLIFPVMRSAHAQNPPAKAAAAEPAKAPAAAAEFTPTDAELGWMTAAQQEFFRWNDKMSEAAQKFGAACQRMQANHHWPDVVCHIDTLAVTPKNPPAVPAATPPPAAATPPAAKEKSPGK